MSVEDVRAIQAQTTQDVWQERWQYFRGPHPSVFVTPKHRRVFQAYAERMGERNYCSLAVKARVARLQITGFDGPDAEQAQAVWDQSRLAQRQDRWYRWALGYGRAWLVADVQQRTLTPNKPTLVGALEDVDDPDQYRVAGKYWTGRDENGDTTARCVLWYADRSEEWTQTSGADWQLVAESPQPAGRVPVVCSDPFGDGPILLDTVAAGQDRVNRLGVSKMIAAEYAAFGAWVLFTRQAVDDGDLTLTPGEAAILDPGEEEWKAAVQQMAPTPLDNYDRSKDSEVDDLMTLALLPRHMRVNPGAPPSGKAITADEGPLIEDVEDHQRELGESLVEGLAMLDVDAEPIWKDPTPHDDADQATEFATLVAGGVPWQYAARQALGWDDEQVAAAERASVGVAGNPSGAALLAAAEEVAGGGQA